MGATFDELEPLELLARAVEEGGRRRGGAARCDCHGRGGGAGGCRGGIGAADKLILLEAGKAGAV
ncbi:hypothetical protein U1Q18_052338 [Sarracenia purpurea var. burkii]